MRYRWLASAVLVSALAVLFVSALSSAQSARADTAYDPEELKFLDLINDYREENGLPTLILSDALTLASERHSEDMGRHDFFAHQTARSSFFPDGSSPWERMSRSGYDYQNSNRAENLAAGYDTAQKAFDAWRSSPGHDRNMRDGNQRVIGIARLEVPGSEYGWYWTTNFGSKKDPTSHAPGEAPDETPSEVETGEKEDRAGVEGGSMNDEKVWEQKTNREGKKLIRGGIARLGGGNGSEDEISQEIQVGEGQKLAYKVRVLTKEEEHPEDGLVVRLTDESGKHLATLDNHTDADAEEEAGEDGWIEDSVDLSRFAGETIRLGFRAKTDDQRPTIFYLDDVTIE